MQKFSGTSDLMENSATSWLSKLEMEDPIFGDEFHNIMDFFDEDLSAGLGDNILGSLSQEGNSSFSTLCAFSETPSFVAEKQAKQPNSNGYNSSSTINDKPGFHYKVSSSPMILTFGNPITTEFNSQEVALGTLLNSEDVLTPHGSLDERTARVQTKANKTGGRKRPLSQTYDHIMAERKRREQIRQQFRALAAIVPGLKKMDKTSVLGEAIKYLKYLQERVKTLEEQTTKQTMESVVLVKKSQLMIEDEGSSDDTGSNDDQSLPEIEAKVYDKKVLLRIHCKNQSGVLIKILSEVEKLNLAVNNTSFVPFGNLGLDITIIAEMEKGFNLTTKELAKSLGSTLQLVP